LGLSVANVFGVFWESGGVTLCSGFGPVGTVRMDWKFFNFMKDRKISLTFKDLVEMFSILIAETSTDVLIRRRTTIDTKRLKLLMMKLKIRVCFCFSCVNSFYSSFFI